MEKIFLFKNASGFCFVDYLAPVYAKALRSHRDEKEIKEPLANVLNEPSGAFPHSDSTGRLVAALLRADFNKTEIEYLLDSILAWREEDETESDEPIDVARPKKLERQTLGIETKKGAALDAMLFLSTDEGLAVSEKLFGWLDAVEELQNAVDAFSDEKEIYYVYGDVVEQYRSASRFVSEAKERLVAVLKEQTGSEDKAERIVDALGRIYDVPELYR